MSAGICGKRLGFEEIFGSAPAPPSAKRSRCARYGSPIRPLDLGLGSDDKVSFLLRMFPSMDREVVETILNAHDHKIDDAIKSLHALCLGDVSVRNEALGQSAAPVPDEHVEDGQTSEQRVEDLQNNQVSSEPGLPNDGSLWVDIFLQEVMKSSNWDDARGRVTQILEAFERTVITNSRASEELEIATLKEHLQCLLRDNQILKRAVAIQHERNVEHEEKLKEVQQLKHMIGQYQEQVRNLELSNYTLKIHLQKAQDPNSIPSHFHPDIF